jgi:hypothetical protein
LRVDLQHLIEQRGQYAERFQTDERINRKAHVGRACGAVEHPGWNLKRPPDIRAVQCAAENAARLIDRAVNENVVPEPGMKSIHKLPADRPVGVPKPCCTIIDARILRSATRRQRNMRPISPQQAIGCATPTSSADRLLLHPRPRAYQTPGL